MHQKHFMDNRSNILCAMLCQPTKKHIRSKNETLIWKKKIIDHVEETLIPNTTTILPN